MYPATSGERARSRPAKVPQFRSIRCQASPAFVRLAVRAGMQPFSVII
jgi:hypothetical protein